jgi:PAS domain S-box-containing protein
MKAQCCSAVVSAAIELLPFGLAITDAHGIITWANPAFARLTGCSADELPGRSAEEFGFGKLSSAAASPRPLIVRAECRRKTGEAYAALHTITTLRDAAGAVTGFWITQEAILAPAPGENPARDAEASLSALLESNQDLIWSVDSSLRLMTFNSAFQAHCERVTGVRLAVGMMPEDYLIPEAAALLPPVCRRALAEGPFRVEYPFKDGRPMELSFHPIYREGRVAGVSVFAKDIAAQKAAEEGLRAQQERFQRIIENTDAGYFRIGRDGRYQDMNPAWLRMHGFTRKEDAVGLHYSAAQAPEDAAKADAMVESVSRGESVSGDEFSHLRRDGTVGYHSFSANPVLEGDRVTGIEGFLVDISNCKQAEREKRHSERRHRSLFDSLNEGVAIHKLVYADGAPADYILLDINRRCEEILGVKREQVVNELATSVYRTENPPYLKEYAAAVATGVPVQFETYFSPMDRYFLISVTPLDDDCFATIFFDVTDQKKTERQYKLVSENSTDVIWLWDRAEARCVYISPSVKPLLGLSPEEVMALSLEQAIPPDRYPRFLAEQRSRIAAVESGEESARISTDEVEYLGKDGTSVAAETVTKFLTDEQGAVTHVVGVTRDITTRKRAEEAVQQANQALVKAEEHYRLMFNSVSDAVFVFKADEDGVPGPFLEVNDSACRSVGYTREELLGMRLFDLAGSRPRLDLQRLHQDLRAKGHLLYEGIVIAKDGRRMPVEVNTHLVDLDGSQTVIASVRDISDRKDAERQYQDIFEGALEGIYRTSVDGKCLAANPALAKMLGYASAEEVVSAIDDSAHQTWLDPKEYLICRKILKERGSIRGYVGQFKRKDGATIWVSINARTAYGADGQPLYHDAFIEDITGQRRAEEEVKTSEHKFRMAFMTGEDAFVIATREEGRILDVNGRFTEIFGYAAEEACGRTSTELGLLTGPDREKLLAELKAKSHASSLELLARGKDGGLRPVLLSASLLQGDGKELVLSVIRDLTEQKRIEEEKTRLEAQFRQAQKLESVGRLAGGVAHDFNNLLTVINGYSDMLLRTLKPSDRSRPYIAEIKKAGEHAASLTKQLLAFSRKQVIKPTMVDLNSTIAESEAMLQRLIGEDIVLEAHPGRLLGQVIADPDQIVQVIMNLAVNARDAMPDGGKLLIATRNITLSEATAARHPEATPGRYVLLTVADTGHGMDEAVRQHVFEPFFTTKELGRGTGLGLSTVYGIVRQGGGWIDVESKVGVGTSFKIYLPRTDGPATGALDGHPASLAGPGATILVVEDQEVVRSFIEATLQQYGYHVLSAFNGHAALEIVRQHPGEIHLLLTDVVMPGMNGKELSERLKELRPSLKVLFTSGYASDVIGRRGVLDDGIEFIPKPFSADTLARKVRAVLAPSAPSEISAVTQDPE